MVESNYIYKMLPILIYFLLRDKSGEYIFITGGELIDIYKVPRERLFLGRTIMLYVHILAFGEIQDILMFRIP